MLNYKRLKWRPPSDWKVIETIDLHTCGEPLRVITEGLPEVKGNTILEKRRFFKDNLDYIRKGIMWEPRGHADMYGAIITEPTSSNGDFGTFFMHNEGYSTMCGHAMIALVKLAIDTGLIKKQGSGQEIIIDAPPGQIRAIGNVIKGKLVSVTFKNVPSFMLMENKTVDVQNIGKVKFDIAFGGAFYAFVNADELGLKLNTGDSDILIDIGRKIKKAVMDKYEIIHPFEDDLSFLYGTIFIAKAFNKNNHSRNVCVFADGELDRSPTGSGVSARAAIHHARGELNQNQLIRIESILGSTMDVKVSETCMFGPHKAVIPEVTGTASFTGRNSFYFDPDDKLGEGFLLR